MSPKTLYQKWSHLFASGKNLTRRTLQVDWKVNFEPCKKMSSIEPPSWVQSWKWYSRNNYCDGWLLKVGLSLNLSLMCYKCKLQGGVGGFINNSSRRTTAFHRWANLFELNFFTRKHAKLTAHPVRLLSALPLMKQ